MPRPRPTRLAAAACLLLCAAASRAQATQPDPAKATEAYLAGTCALDHHDLTTAQTRFAEAALLDPTRPGYARALSLTRDRRVTDLVADAAKARLGGNPTQADALLDQARTLDPTNELVLAHTEAHTEAGLPTPTSLTPQITFLPPIHVQPDPAVKDLHLRGDTRQAVAELARDFGVNAVFDDSVTAQPYRFDLPQTTYAEAMPILLRAAGFFAVPLDRKAIFVAKDTQENRTRLEHLLEETVYVPGSTAEQLNELTNVVKNVFDITKAVVSPNAGTLTLRAPEDTLNAVNATLKDLLDGDAQIVLELKLITVDKTRTLDTGLNTPTSLGAFNAFSEAQSLVSANQALVSQAIASGGLAGLLNGNLIHDTIIEALALIESGLVTDPKFTGLVALLGSVTNPTALLTGLYLTSGATFNFALNTSEAHALDDLTVRVGDRQTTTLKIGEKYPITTSTYSSGLTASQTAAVAGATIGGQPVSSLLAAASAATIPIIQYEDLGITLKTQPTVLKSGLVSLHIDLKIEALTGASLDNIPILTSRSFVSDITVPDGSPAMMVSVLNRTESAALSGIPGLESVPGLAQSLDGTLRERDSSELVLLATPHVIRRRSGVLASRRIAFRSTLPAEY